MTEKLTAEQHDIKQLTETLYAQYKKNTMLNEEITKLKSKVAELEEAAK